MDELIQKIKLQKDKVRFLIEELEKEKKILIEDMKLANLNRLEFNDGSYLRRWEKRVDEGMSWFGRNKPKTDE